MSLLLLTLLACSATPTDDADGDGYTTATDCDDKDAGVHPGADDPCDGVDDDCDGVVDYTSAFYADADGDGYGDEGSSQVGCEAPAGYVADATDCDDTDAGIHPGADESDCTDPVDYNCDGSVTWADADGDGAPACEDCDDSDPSAFPGGTETCDGVDNDCDGEVDVNAADGVTYFRDADGDGAAGDSDPVVACHQPEGTSTDVTDCNDADPDVHPGADEVCNELDDDCDAEVDEDAVDAPTWYVDGDGDGYAGTAGASSCTAPDGMSATADDCDDTSAAVSPAATELCDGVDDDCDGTVDIGAADGVPLYVDHDGDGHGTGTSAGDGCPGVGGALVDDDCDDSHATAYPGAAEVCDDLDNDCDGLADDTDPDVTDPTAWYVDLDGDGYGTDGSVVFRCDGLPGEVAFGGDCDDADASLSPGTAELCDGIDDDCDGAVDDADGDVTGGTTWYVDGDGDGAGAGTTTVVACVQPSGYSDRDDDCDDADVLSSPTLPEICGGRDEDCDGLVDKDDPDLDTSTETTFYLDADADGHGDATLTEAACTAPAGYVATGDDCDDADATLNPGATELCDGLDQDCDGLVDDDDPSLADGTELWHDRDGDGVGGDDAYWYCTTAPTSGYATATGDCDDTDASVSSGCTEPTFAESYDVVIVGTGPAGMAAALSAKEMGATVLLLDKASQAGIGQVAGQGLFGVGTKWQADEGVTDSVEAAADEWSSITGVDGHQESVLAYLEATAELLEWLESYGLHVASLESRDDIGSVARAHVVAALDSTTGGAVLVENYTDEIRTEIEVTGPVMWDGQLVGVRYDDLATGTSGTIGAKTVILATGGYQRDEDLVRDYLPDLATRPWVWECILQSDAGGENFADLLGAAYINRENIGTYVHSMIDPYATDDHEALISYNVGNGIMVGTDGKRFADESYNSSFDYEAELPAGDVFTVFDTHVGSYAGFWRPFYNWASSTSSEYYDIGDLLGVSPDLYNASTLADLAAQAGIDAAGLEATVDAYNDDVAIGATDEFGRDLSGARSLDDGDWYAFRMAIGVAKTFGGIQTDIDAEVLDEDGVAIPGLYAAGEAIGYLPGGGSGAGWGGAVSAAYYGGRLAGENAASYAAVH